MTVLSQLETGEEENLRNDLFCIEWDLNSIPQTLDFATVRRSSEMLSPVDGQCDKLVTVINHQFITLTVHICGREAPRSAGLSAAAETFRVMFDGYM